MKTIWSVTAGLVAMLIQTAVGSTLWQEGFDYPNGQLTAQSGGTWLNFSGTGNFIQTTNGEALVSGYVTSGAEDVRRPLGTSITTGSLYLGATVKLTVAPTSPNGEYFLSFYNSPTTGGGYVGRIFSSQTGTGSAFGLSNAGSAPTDWATDASLGTFYKIIAKLDLATQIATLGVFAAGYIPTSDTELTLSGGAASAITAVDSIALRQATAVQGSQTIGSIWVGTELADVSGVVVPEPGGAALLGLGFAFLGMRRRK
jgi:hypothetical protein